MKLKNIINQLNQLYPQKLACDWDNVGLIIGDKNQEIETVLTTLEVTDKVVEEAIKKKVDLIISHHPIIFKPISNLCKNNQNDKLLKLIKNDIAVFVMHTNVDLAIKGMNDWLAEEIGLENVYELNQEYQINLLQIEIKDETKNFDQIRDALKDYELNLSALNNVDKSLYDFTNLKENSKTYRGFILEADKIKVIEELQKRNIDNFNLQDINYPKLYLGLGRVGYIPVVQIKDLAAALNKKFGPGVKYTTKNPKRKIKKVALVGGSGYSYLHDAIKEGCDVLITGDIKYHDAQIALEENIDLIDIGHFAENIFAKKMQAIVKQIGDLKVIKSSVNINPFSYV